MTDLAALLAENARYKQRLHALDVAWKNVRQGKYEPQDAASLRDWVGRDAGRSMPTLPSTLAQWVLDVLDERDALRAELDAAITVAAAERDTVVALRAALAEAHDYLLDGGHEEIAARMLAALAAREPKETR